MDDALKVSCREWAEDFTHIRDLCIKAGIPQRDIDGDSFGVPGIQDLADLLFAQSEKLKGEILNARISALEEARELSIRNLPPNSCRAILSAKIDDAKKGLGSNS